MADQELPSIDVMIAFHDKQIAALSSDGVRAIAANDVDIAAWVHRDIERRTFLRERLVAVKAG
jgi:phosphopantetheine adenylyltransferase